MSFIITLKTGKSLRYDHPIVMGIVNLTPDSFYSQSQMLGTKDSLSVNQQVEPDVMAEAEQRLRNRVAQIIREGAEMIDVGACSTRPGYQPPSAEEELRRLEWGLPIIHSAMQGTTPLPISVDTYRASVAEAAVTRLGADIINDVYAGTRDSEMFPVVERTGVPYILTADSAEVDAFFAERLALLSPEARSKVILDPGYGFSKSLQDNYRWMKLLPQLMERYADYPMLIGISRKSMIYRLLGTDPDHSLNGTTALNTFSLMAGAHILRVHDVREAWEAVQIVSHITAGE